MLAQGEIKASVNLEYAHALGISHLQNAAQHFLLDRWTVIYNQTKIKFLTNDDPSVKRCGPFEPTAASPQITKPRQERLT